ncbi:dTDP-4-dehydrorhamnose reductase [Aliihoeflea aestuarii]|nr:dTDP-4-dehydrorhamnose reductase [Aliihoeflea aestuarii]
MREKGWANLPETSKTRVLVLGKSGQLAQALSRARHPDASVICAGRPELDLENPASIRSTIARHAPDVVINAGAFTAVDRAESEPESAMAINAKGAGNAATACKEAGLPIIHISTDYVFSGNKAAPYVESDPTGPINAYGRSKLAGEAEVAACNPAHVILRTGWLYAPWGTNFARTMMRLAQEREIVRVVSDQFGTPTYVPHLAETILRVALTGAKTPDRRGVFHAASSGEGNWADFAERLFAASKRLGGPYARVDRIGSADYPTPAARPAYSVLSTTKLHAAFGLELPAWQASADAFVEIYLRDASTAPVLPSPVA